MPAFKRSFFVFVLLAASTCQGVYAAQYSSEQRLSRQLMKTIKVGEAMMLMNGDRGFLGIYTAATTPRSRGGVILLHDLGAHADWPELISPLRTALPNYGWNTLSLQLPLLSNQPDAREFHELFTEAQARITAAIAYFGERGIFNIALVGYGVGGAIGLNYLATVPHDSKVIAFAGLAVYDHELADDSLLTVRAIADVKIPVLDVAGNLDSDRVTVSAKAREMLAMKSSNSNYRLWIPSGADHFFSGLEAELIRRMRVWLQKQAPSMEVGAKGFVPDAKKKNNAATK